MSTNEQKPNSVRPSGTKQSDAKASPYALDNPSRAASDWGISDVNAGDLRLAIAAILAAGDAVMFSCARKGVAYCITVYHDGIPVKQWATEQEEVEEALARITTIALSRVPKEVQEKLTIG